MSISVATHAMNDPGMQALFPNALQLAVLRAGFCMDEEFPARWQELQSALATFSPTHPFVDFLPLLYRRLPPESNDELSHAVRMRYRQVWASNHIMFHGLSACLRTLHAAGIRTLLLKGSALLVAYYQDMGLRSMGDFDVLVPHADFGAAIAALIAEGWTAAQPIEGFDGRFTHALTLRDQRGNVLDLHAHVLHFTTCREADDIFWKNSVPLNIHGIETRRLSGPASVLHIAVHGLRWSIQPSLQWSADIARILSVETMEWDRLVALASTMRASIAVRTTIEYLAEQRLVTVPPQALAALSSTAIRPEERRAFELSSHDAFDSLRRTAELHWYTMTHQLTDSSLLRKLRLIPAYLSHRARKLEVKSVSSLIGGALLRRLKGRLGLYQRTAIDHRVP